MSEGLQAELGLHFDDFTFEAGAKVTQNRCATPPTHVCACLCMRKQLTSLAYVYHLQPGPAACKGFFIIALFDLTSRKHKCLFEFCNNLSTVKHAVCLNVVSCMSRHAYTRPENAV